MEEIMRVCESMVRGGECDVIGKQCCGNRNIRGSDSICSKS
jgi:hypothetical protein